MNPSTRNGTSRRRILVADDEPHIRRVLETLLETSGFDVDSVCDGAEALARGLTGSRVRELDLGRAPSEPLLGAPGNRIGLRGIRALVRWLQEGHPLERLA